MIIGYIRVSTIEQDLKNQKNAILEFCNSKKLIVDDFIQVESSSRHSKRSRKINEVTEALKKGDIIIVTELSRLGRSVSEVLGIVSAIIDKKSRLICIKESIDIQDNHSIQSKIMITMVGLFAELERDLISQRTKEALAYKKSIGVKLGRPRGPGKSKLQPHKESIEKYLDKNISVMSIAKLLDVSYTTLHNFIKKNRILKGSEKAKILAQRKRIEKVKLHLNIVNNKRGRGIKPSIQGIKDMVLPYFDPSFRNIGHNKFILRIQYKDMEELNITIEQLLNEICRIARLKNCNASETFIVSVDQDNLSWELPA